MTPKEKDDWDLVKGKLSAILSISEGEAAALIRNGHRDEVPHFAEHFRAVAGKWNNQWLGRLQAGLPRELWKVSPEGERHLEAGREVSMRYLSQEFFDDGTKVNDGEDEAAVGKKYLETRELLFKGLDLAAWPYQAMTKWFAPADFRLKTPLPLNGDIAFSEVLIWLENELNKRLQKRSQQRRAGRFEKATPTPPEMILACSREALEEMKEFVSAWCSDSSRAGTLPDSLGARVAANASVNRALLEWSAKDRFGREAAKLSIGFLRSLNASGIVKIPAEVAGWERGAVAKRRLADLLRRWFGYDGQLVDSPHFARGGLAEGHIQAVANWSESLQRYFIDGRGGGDAMYAEEVHGQPTNLFLFGLAVASSFYVRGNWGGKSESELIQTQKELPVPKKGGVNTYSVSASVVDNVLSVHAAEVLAQVYSQMFFGNESDHLRADEVQAYAQLQSVKRAHVEQLLEHAIKGRSSQQLMNLFTHVYPLVQEEKKWALAGGWHDTEEAGDADAV